jgi:hypothetical protein
MFLSKRNSQVDVVESVGRVMRNAPGKKYGYIIIPVIIPENMSPEDALDHSDCYAVVWTVLNALRAHDDRFNAEINKIELNKGKSGKIIVDVIGKGDGSGDAGGSPYSATATQDEFDFRAKIYAKMVKKVGTRRYWSLWAEEVAKIAARHSARMKGLITAPGEKRDEFLKFLDSLRENLNPTISEEDAADMLVQHALTKPIFDAVFDGYDFFSEVLLAFDKDGQLQWQQSVKFDNELTYDLYPHSAEGNCYDELVVASPYRNKLRYTSFNMEGRPLMNLQEEKLAPIYGADYVDDEHFAQIGRWYGSRFIIYGSQVIQNSSQPQAKRSVFYLQKVQYD